MRSSRNWLAFFREQIRELGDRTTRVPPFPAWLARRWPASPWATARHLRYIAQVLNDLPPGGQFVLNMPPRHGKTQTASVRYVAWRLLRDPALHVIVCSHTQGLAQTIARQVRRIVTEAGVLIDPTHNRVDDWRTAAGGGVRAAGVGSGIAGFGAQLIVVDDPHRNREAADSLHQREQLWEWWNDDLLTRREPGCQVLVVMTRYHPDDLTGRVLAANPAAWTVIRLPARADAPDDPLGRALGEPLWPEQFDAAALARIEAQVDPRTWAALYQQAPRLADTVAIDPDWFLRWRPEELPVMVGRWISWDTAEGVDRGAYSVAWVADLGTDGVLYVRDRVRVRLPFTELITRMLDLIRSHVRDGLREVLVEFASNGGAAFDVLQRDVARAGLPVAIVPIRPSSTKLLRAEMASVPIRQGLVRLPADAPWLPEFFQELAAFPHGPFADQVDALTQLVTYLAHWITPVTADVPAELHYALPRYARGGYA